MKKIISLLLAGIMILGAALPVMGKDLADPRVVADSSSTSGQKTTWDCIYFGSYPQAEVVASSSYSAVKSAYLLKGDLIVDSTLYAKLKKATWKNGVTTINGNKYQRIKKSDATYVGMEDSDDQYNWSASSATYRYFKYEPIKWRVLSIDGSEALLLADKALDDQKYNTEETNITWADCTLRTWLNSTFLNRAFTKKEQTAIISQKLKNEDNNYWGTKGGKDTTDQVFLLSEDDVYTYTYDYNSESYVNYGGNADQYGFASFDETADDGRKCASTTFAKAMGTWWAISTTGVNGKDYYYENSGSCHWRLRTVGAPYLKDYGGTAGALYAATVFSDGMVGSTSFSVQYPTIGTRPAITLDLSDTSLWTYAGTKNSTWSLAQKKAITKSNAAVILTTSVYTYNGSEKKPGITVYYNGEKLTRNKDYTVSYSNNKNVGLGKVTIKGIGNYKGTIKKTFKIIPKGTSVSKLTASSRGFTIKWKKQKTQVTGYQIRYSTSSKMKNARIVTIGGRSSTSRKITKLLAQKKYYVQVRTYKKVSGTSYHSKWSSVKSVTTKS